MSGSVYFICQNNLSVGELTIVETVKEKEVGMLFESCMKRKNANHTRWLENLKEVTVHTVCKKRYSNPKLISAYIRLEFQEGAKSAVVARVRSRARGFNFREHGFLCGEGVTTEFKERQKRKPIDHRFQVHKVLELSFCKRDNE